MSKNNRPYMVITHRQKPAKGVHTNTKVTDEATRWEVTENMVILDRPPSSSKSASASLVMDLLEGKVLKNRFAGEVSDTEIFTRYFEQYREDITEALKEWALRSPENLMQLDKLVVTPEQYKEANSAPQQSSDSN